MSGYNWETETWETAQPERLFPEEKDQGWLGRFRKDGDVFCPSCHKPCCLPDHMEVIMDGGWPQGSHETAVCWGCGEEFLVEWETSPIFHASRKKS